jgi:uncharacterized protein YggU (UPF0235/DUF167 family)
MDDQDIHLHSGRTGAAITVQITVGASKNEIIQILDDGTLDIRLSEPKIGKKADESLIDFLAQILNVNRKKVEIIAGLSGRCKLITILDMDTSTVQARIIRNTK